MVRIDLWYVRTDAVDASLAAACLATMAAPERERHARSVFERRRHKYLVTRGLARGALATYVDETPSTLAFWLTEHGRPLLERGGELRFNLTNTVELVVCAVARGHEIGVDAELLARADEILGMSEVVFTPDELDRLFDLSLPSRRRRAVELWTQKEGYIKARGLGLSLPIDRFEVVHPTDGGEPVLRFFPPIDDVPSRWRLRTLELEEHLVSVCVEAAIECELDIEVRRADIRTLLDSWPLTL